MIGAACYSDHIARLVNVLPVADAPVAACGDGIGAAVEMGLGELQVFLPLRSDADGKNGDIATFGEQVVNQA